MATTFDPTQPPANYAPTPGSTTSSPATTAYNTASAMGLAWTLPLFEHYLGKEPSYQDLVNTRKAGLNYDMLVEHLRSQPSHVKGMTIGTLEDFHKAASPAFYKWTGHEATDQDIQALATAGVTTPDAIEKYLTNRPDVMAAHPGAPIGLSDEAWGQHKAAINSQYQANLGTDATDQQARDAYSQAATPFRKAPAEQVGLSAGVGVAPSGANQGALMDQAQIAPNARQSAI